MDGSLSRDVLDQLPRLAGQQYVVACVTVGTNDILFDWDADEFAGNLATIVAAASASADRVVVPTISLGLAAFPGSAADFRRRAREANALIGGCGALVLDAEDLRGPRHLGADRIHPTLAGQLVLADRAAAVLESRRRRRRSRALHDGPLEEVAPIGPNYARDPRDQVPRRMAKRLLGRADHTGAPIGT